VLSVLLKIQTIQKPLDIFNYLINNHHKIVIYDEFLLANSKRQGKKKNKQLQPIMSLNSTFSA
jgi:hypothetical protein